MIQALPALLGATAGAIAGSFLATIILRWPRGRSVLRGRSACDGCGRVLGAVDLVPMLSALIQRGRCRTCGAPIDPLHGRVEAGCAIIGALALGFAPDPGGVGWALLGWLLLTLAVLDRRHFWLPDALTLPLAFLGFTMGPWATEATMADRAIGALAGYLALLLIAFGYRRTRGRDGLGLGDAKLLGALGAWFGWQALPFILLLAASVGLLSVVAVMATGRRVDGTTRVPLGAFLAIAAVPGWWLATILTGGGG
ncbi:type 4 prepilin-like proteins leader peptide-processing enzyme [Sphingobium sp. TA15]|uniref:Prepilin leader peptidase/N-methyltransferase n=1 Tax=Sphingobium indicum (strain DSM 16413 / CCM 7287 / MTCC 6362 / UT26 / NBRC 101211 / UT26S) TaxID=452662 RepID=D4Z3J7_SPHIU|nr:A24 family peptidase [Sphingobium indicum]BAI97179.1 type II secretory pathway prepilin signal peptidase PulO [Sphingobium indicum UT26S]BDD66600.1 type 4 prepilin-like proteins leader peptide-processing enzyme [Sphingobium sp. TA15]